MDSIRTFLSNYGITLQDCHPDWIDMVDEYDGIKSALPAEVRQLKESEIIEAFKVFHTVEEEVIQKKPVKAEKKKAPPVTKEPAKHQFDAQALLDKADNIANLI